MKVKFIIIASLFFPLLANAGTGSGKVLGFIPYSAGANELFVVNSSENANKAACNTTNRYAMSSSDLRYKATQAALLVALMAGTPVIIKGKGTCTAWSNTEDIDYICVGNIPC